MPRKKSGLLSLEKENRRFFSKYTYFDILKLEKKMKKKLSLLIFCLLPIFFYANGGIPYNSIENGPAKICLVNDKDLILEKEHLTIKFEDDFALVTCEYELKNNTDKDKTVNFAFNIPITVGTYLSEKYSLIYYGIFDNNMSYNQKLWIG